MSGANHPRPHRSTACRCCSACDDPDGPGPAINTGFCAECNAAGCPDSQCSDPCLVTGEPWRTVGIGREVAP